MYIFCFNSSWETSELFPVFGLLWVDHQWTLFSKHPCYRESSLEYKFRSGIAEPQGRLTSTVLRNNHTDFRTGCTNFHSQQQWMSAPFHLHPCHHEASLFFTDLRYLTGVRNNLKFIFICFSLIANDIVYLFKCSVAIWIPIIENFLFFRYPTF